MHKLMLGAALAPFVALGACSTVQVEQTAAQVEQAIQSGAAAACGVIPTVSTVLSVIAAVTGQSEIVGLTQGAIAAIEGDICSAVPAPASARFRALPRASLGKAPAVIGVSKSGTTVVGWRA
jgi:hypothetical protein